ARKAGVMPDQCIFVGENSKERSYAISAGFLRVSPHPILTTEVLKGASLVYARVKLSTDQVAKWNETRELLPVVPLHVTGETQKFIYAITTIRAIDAFRSANIEIEVLGRRDAPL